MTQKNVVGQLNHTVQDHLKRKELIYERLQSTFHPHFLEVVDESDEHIGHAGHQGGGRHFAIVIAADCFKSLNKIACHRAIYALFSDLMPNTIHALRIKVIE